MNKKTVITLLIVVLLLAALVPNVHIYNGLNKGIALNNVGGYEFVGTPGFFTCEQYPLGQVFPAVAVDC